MSVYPLRPAVDPTAYELPPQPGATTGNLARTLQGWDHLDSLAWPVRAFGAVGDGTTDDTAAIQAALDAVASSDGRSKGIYFDEGVFRTTDTLFSDVPNIALVGPPGNVGQSEGLAPGCAVIETQGGIIGFQFGDGSSSVFGGPRLHNVHLRDGTGGGLGGILLLRCSNWILDNVACSGYVAGYGLSSDGTGNVNQAGQLYSPKMNNCLVGLHFKLSNEIDVFGPLVDSNDNSGSPRASSIGVRIESGDTVRIHGGSIKNNVRGIYVEAGESHELHGTRFEGNTTNVKVGASAKWFKMFGGSISNNILGGTGTGVEIDSGATDTYICHPQVTSVATRVSDGGTRTVWEDDDPGWTNVAAFDNSWANKGGGDQVARYRKRGKDVDVEGVIASGTNATSPFTLPAGYRPTLAEYRPLSTSGGNGTVSVAANGVVTVFQGTGTISTACYLGRITFTTS